jgi:alanyl aminopeptidase
VRRVREPIVTHDDIVNAFDDITYAKGAAVLFMLERWLGPEAFRAGVQRYLARHAWKNATADDFIAALSEGSGQDVRGVLSGFLDQPGFPIITTTLDCRGARPTVTLAQARSHPSGAEPEAPPWRLPICVAWNGGRQCTLLDGATGVLELETTCPAWLVGNAEFAGYYRVRPLRAALLAEPGLSAPERFGVATDLEALVELGEVSMAEQLEAVSAAAASSDRVLVTHAANFTEGLWDVVPEASRPHLARFVRRKFGARAKALGFTPRAGEDEDAALLRPGLLGLVGWAGDDATVRAEALKRARAWLRARDELSPDVVKVTLRVAARTNDPKFFDDVLAAAATERDAHARRLLLTTLGFFSAPALARRALAFSLAEGSDPRETLTLITALAGMPETHTLAVDFVKTHYAELTRALPREWEGELVTLATSTCAPDERADIEAFFAPRSAAAPGGPREYANALETFDDCVAWRARVTPDLVRFLAR